MLKDSRSRIVNFAKDSIPLYEKCLQFTTSKYGMAAIGLTVGISVYAATQNMGDAIGAAGILMAMDYVECKGLEKVLEKAYACLGSE